MPIPFICPHCGAQTQVADQYAGQSGPCARCGKIVTVPGTAGDIPLAAPRRSNTLLIVCLVLGAMLVVGLMVIGILAALLLPAVQTAREGARSAMCQSNLKQIAIALASYESAHGRFPPAYLADKDGKPMHSWRVLLLPHLERQDLYQQYRFDESWDGPNNRKLANLMPNVYRCPSAPDSSLSTTSYMVVAGPHTLFPGSKAISPYSSRDGTASTATVVETIGMDVNWMEPRDLDERQLDKGVVSPKGRSKGIGSFHARGPCVATADSACHFLNPKVRPETLRSLFDPNDGKPLDTQDAFNE